LQFEVAVQVVEQMKLAKKELGSIRVVWFSLFISCWALHHQRLQISLAS